MNWFAPTDVRFAERVDPWVDWYVKKSLLRDRVAYLTPTEGHTVLNDHYSARFALHNPPRSWNVPSGIIGKLAIGPAFSTGAQLMPMFEADVHGGSQDRLIDLHARIATKGSPWYQHMRIEAKQAASRLPAHFNVVSDGRVDRAEFMAELGRSKLCFSPFGYGEICWRDFEAVAMGSVLIKPDMAHVESEPDIYRAFETYLPVRWDLADLNERVAQALADPAGMRRMAERAFAVVRDHLRGRTLEHLIEQLTGRSPLNRHA